MENGKILDSGTYNYLKENNEKFRQMERMNENNQNKKTISSGKHYINKVDISLINKVLNSNFISSGPYNYEFEKNKLLSWIKIFNSTFKWHSCSSFSW